MQTYSLTNQEAAKQGYTHMINVTEADFTATSGGNETINLVSLAAGDYVDNVCVEIVTPFAHGNSGTSLDLGATGALDELIDGGSLELTAGKIILQGSGTNATAAGVGVNTAGNFTFKISLTTTTDVSSLTAGSVNVWCRINRAADRKDPALDNG